MAASAGSIGTAVLLTAVVAAGAVGAANGSTGGDQERDARAVDRAGLWVGTVVGHTDRAVRLDVGGTKDAFVVLARVTNQDTCRTHADVRGDYARALLAATPVGSTLAVLRSRHPNGEFRERYDDHGFVHPVLADGRTPDLDAPSVNEDLVTAGVARPDPPAPTEPAARQQAVREARARMSAKDHAYWTRFVQAHDEALRAETGQTGACARQERAAAAAAAESERQAREQEDEDRRRRAAQARRDAAATARQDDSRRRTQAWLAAVDRWVVGPDGRRGTGDDARGPYPAASEYGVETGGGGGRSCDGDGDGVCYE